MQGELSITPLLKAPLVNQRWLPVPAACNKLSLPVQRRPAALLAEPALRLPFLEAEGAGPAADMVKCVV